MLPINFLVLIAKLELGSGKCEHGTLKVKDFDWNKFSGPRTWYLLLHNPNDFENNLDCPESLISSPEGNRSNFTTDVYDISANRHMKIYGYATNWNSSGCFEFQHEVPLWNGISCVLAVDYDSYVVIKQCKYELNKPDVYVMFRSQRPDEATVKEVLKELESNNIDISQLVEMRAEHCQRAESSFKRGSST